MDEATAELLSRFLDGDLDAAEIRLLEQRLATEPGLAVELEALRRLQLQVRSVAERMQLPAELEAPPRLPGHDAAPLPRRVPPAVRWLGLAAGLALAVTVTLELSRRPPSSPAPARDAAPPAAAAPAVASPAPPRVQALEPAAPAPADELTKAAAAPSAESSQTAARPPQSHLPPPDPQLPAATREKRTAAVGGRGPAASAEALEEVDTARADRAPEPGSRGPAAANEAAREREPAQSATSSEQAAFAGIAAGAAKQEGAAGGARLELIGEDGIPVAALALPAAAPAHGSRLVVTVAGGAIATIEPEAADAVADPALAGFIGRQLPGVADGRYVGVVVGRDPAP
jgi:hypothetical protein